MRNRKSPRTKDKPGLTFEKVVARIQQKIDPNSVVTHNEILRDRVGNERQYDVVIRGHFGGRPVLGIMECKDHSKKLGPSAVEAFAKKTENVGANLRIMISKKGFTKSALKLAKHDNVGCLSLLPNDPIQSGFSIGDMWYGIIETWENVHLSIKISSSPDPILVVYPMNLKLEGKSVGLWFLKELINNHGDEQEEDTYFLDIEFDDVQKLEINGQQYFASGLICDASRICRKKRKLVTWSGDAFYDWHTGKFTMPSGGTLTASPVNTDLMSWPDYTGEIPKIGKGPGIGLMQGILRLRQTWDNSLDTYVPDLNLIGRITYKRKSR